MNSAQVVRALKLTAQLMELHGVNEFKAKSLANAAFKLGKAKLDLESMSLEELGAMDGFGKGIVEKVKELRETGSMQELNELLEQTPSGVVHMLGIKGLGPKKVAQLWKELQIESVGELQYACTENRLIDLKGFGVKTQESILQAIEFALSNSGRYYYAQVESFANSLIDALKKKYPGELVELSGPLRRKCEIIEQVDIVTTADTIEGIEKLTLGLELKIEVITSSKEDFTKVLFEQSAAPDHLDQLKALGYISKPYTTEEDIYKDLSLQFIPVEMREGLSEINKAKSNSLKPLIEYSDLKGILHNHTNYSDGIHTLEEMALACIKNGYEYLGICDHSQSAFYAGGLKPDKVERQQQEIDQLNKKLAPFRIFKGIESDILGNGNLDYTDDILKTFDLVVASVHSNLKMDIEKATARLLKAIENPYTTILGHPTGRLLLSRAGYPLHFKKIIDACAANGVIMELNANPHRLDIDWRWIDYCLEKNVMISINPDAHSIEGLKDMYYGTCVARKGGLHKQMCFNALSLEEMNSYLNKRKPL